MLEYLDVRKHPDPELLEAVYRQLFQPSFPDPDEQETPEDWLPRLSTDPPPAPPEPEQHGFVAGTHLSEPATRSLAGFAFVERYRRSRCGLLSYIAVDSSFRRRGVARELFMRARDSAELSSIAEGEPLRCVFAEIHDPHLPANANDVIDPSERVRVMRRLGAQRVPIRYVQPALGDAAKPSDRLMLVAFAPPGEHEVDAEVVRDFLREYYTALDAPPDDPELARMEEELGTGPIKLAPLEPHLEFEQFGVALHFAVRLPKGTNAERHRAPPAANRSDDLPNPFASFEADLLSYRYVPGRDPERPKPIFASDIVDTKLETVTLCLPGRIPYVSEGKPDHLDLPGRVIDGRRRRRVALEASRTDFVDSDVSVFHLIFTNVEPPRTTALSAAPSELALDEYDLVALSKLWQGGEEWAAEDEIGFLAGETDEEIGIDELAHLVFDAELRSTGALTPPDPTRVRLGTIQLITAESTRDIPWHEIWADVEALQGDHEPQLKHHGPVESLGGVIQGLLDFQAIDVSELMDVFEAHHVDSDLIGMHKGTVLCVMESDRSYEAAAERIGISPYLVLPQAVLLHNEAVLDEGDRCWERSRTTYKAEDLERLGNEIRTLLGTYLSNVFHYPQEEWLLEQGEKTRDLAARSHQLGAQLKDVEARWEQAVAARRRLADDLRTALLLLLALLPMYPFLSYWHQREAFGLLILFAAWSVVWPRRDAAGERLARTRVRLTRRPSDPS